MKLTVTFRHMDVSPAVKEHVEDKLDKLSRYMIGPSEAHVIIHAEKIMKNCEIVLSEKTFRTTAKAESENMYTAIDTAVDKLERQLIKHKEIVKEHKHHASARELASQPPMM